MNLVLNIIQEPEHMCYILKSSTSDRIYIGYTIDLHRRVRQHNGEIVGGAKKTRKGRPWYPIYSIKGFPDNHTALRFEYRLHHPHIRKSYNETAIAYAQKILMRIVANGDGSIAKNTKAPWPQSLMIYTHQPPQLQYQLPQLQHPSSKLTLNIID